MGSSVLTVMSQPLPAPDRSLISRARDGEPAAREELARAAGRSAYVFALQLTRQPETAKDIAQESLIRFFRRLDRVDENQSIDPWLFTIVRNQVRDTARREQVRRHDSLDAWLDAGGQKTASDATDPALAAERRELQLRVWQGISQLSAAHREILVLRDYHDLSYRELASVLSIPEGTVMSRLHAARKRLREILGNER